MGIDEQALIYSWTRKRRRLFRPPNSWLWIWTCKDDANKFAIESSYLFLFKPLHLHNSFGRINGLVHWLSVSVNDMP